ncbi:MAG: YggS family pyridoxal phosphate-dependent enzyme [Gammaproteobacteria bacterium]|nr:YggS family pyridoxal phosphate-dependent enzyme [Gammaproteobacteria bacterium]
MHNNIAERLTSAYQQIAEITAKCQREASTAQLIAVSKTKPVADISEAYAAGQRAFGENYVQELVEKAQFFENRTDIRWHFIGPIQSNKTRDIAAFADVVHSIERAKIAERLAAQRKPSQAPLQVLIQINISGEASKSGVLPTEMLALAKVINDLPQLELIGLMAIPEPAVAGDNPQAFQAMVDLSKQLTTIYPQANQLSMGMSDDWQQALTFGATMIRLGTAIFGHRETTKHE